MSDNAESNDAMLYEVNNHVATITFNRPEQQNTINGPMLKSLTQYPAKGGCRHRRTRHHCDGHR